MFVSNCLDTTLHLWTPTRPAFLGENRGIFMAPHNAHYGELRNDLVAAGLAQHDEAAGKVRERLVGGERVV